MRIMSSQTALATLGADCLVLFISDKEEEIFYTMDFRNNRKVRFSLENAPGLVGKVLSLDTVIVSPDAVGERDFDESVDDFPVSVKKRRRAAEQVMIAVPIYDTKDDTIIGALKTAAMVFMRLRCMCQRFWPLRFLASCTMSFRERISGSRGYLAITKRDSNTGADAATPTLTTTTTAHPKNKEWQGLLQQALKDFDVNTAEYSLASFLRAAGPGFSSQHDGSQCRSAIPCP